MSSLTEGNDGHLPLREQAPPEKLHVQNLRLGLVAAAALVLGQTGQNVTLPIYADTVGNAGGTPYFVVWFASLSFVVLFGAALATQHAFGLGNSEAWFTKAFQKGPMLIGLCDALNGMMVVFASPSNRTAPYLQAILGNFMVPLTILVRAKMRGRRPTNRQCLAATFVLIGLFVSLLPNIFGWGEAGPAVATRSTFWPICFMVGFLPAVVMNVLQETSLGQEHLRTGVLPFVFFLNLWQFGWVNALAWLDIVPGYGMSSGGGAWAHHMLSGLRCAVPGLMCGDAGFLWGALFVLCYMLAYVASAILMKNTEGAVWQAVITSVVGPLGTLWWAIFQPKPAFHFAPAWGDQMTFAVLGLAVMVPGVAIYHLQGKRQ